MARDLPYAGHLAVLATRHGKLPLIAPPLATIGLQVEAVEVDTDQLGTFTGEVPRPGTPLETAVAKARLGMDATGSSLGLASEGSIGPHPALPMVTADVEVVVLVDGERELVVSATATGLDILAASRPFRPDHDLAGLARHFDLAEHAVIVRPNLGPPTPVFKALRATVDISAAIANCAAVSPDGQARVETDLRAHVCPSRRPTIRLAAERLAQRLNARCPSCANPGWGPVETVTGLPCGRCGAPTEERRAEVDGCTSCGHRAERVVVPDGTTGDPARCPRCNP